MGPACSRLFEYALSFITREDIEKFCVNDPGYPDYVREWTQILVSRAAPERMNFDINEIIMTTGPEYAQSEENPERYLRFCIFTGTVAAAIAKGQDGDDLNIERDEIGRNLMECAHALSDPVLFQLLPGVLAELDEE